MAGVADYVRGRGTVFSGVKQSIMEAKEIFYCEKCRANKSHYYSFKEVKWVCGACNFTTEYKGFVKGLNIEL